MPAAGVRQLPTDDPHEEAPPLADLVFRGDQQVWLEQPYSGDLLRVLARKKGEKAAG